MSDGQARVLWDQTPIDMFFAYDPSHDEKAVFNRPKDWVDIDAILALGPDLDVDEILRWVGRIAGDDDPRYNRVGAVLTRR